MKIDLTKLSQELLIELLSNAIVEELEKKAPDNERLTMLAQTQNMLFWRVN